MQPPVTVKESGISEGVGYYRSIIDKYAFSTKKRFGQNFLTSRPCLHQIADLVDVKETDTIVEIGPGLGFLSEVLLPRAETLTLVEIDRDAVAALRDRFSDKKLTVIEGDALKVDYSKIVSSKAKLVGNLPYNIASPLLLKLLAHKSLFSGIYIMVQKEVATQICAPSGKKPYGRLSVMTQVHATCHLCFDVKPGSFFPAPKVMSSFIELRPNRFKFANDTHRDVFSAIVRSAFGQRRKTLRNSLKSLVLTLTNPETFEVRCKAVDIDLGYRAEQLPVEDFKQLASVYLSLGGQYV